jgi:hypothetical protein
MLRILYTKQFNQIKERYQFSYRPNHVDGWWWSGWALDVAPEGRPLSAGGPCFLLTNLNIIVLNKVRNISKRNINENLKRKKKKFRTTSFPGFSRT